jgi:hypothetical protein
MPDVSRSSIRCTVYLLFLIVGLPWQISGFRVILFSKSSMAKSTKFSVRSRPLADRSLLKGDYGLFMKRRIFDPGHWYGRLFTGDVPMQQLACASLCGNRNRPLVSPLLNSIAPRIRYCGTCWTIFPDHRSCPFIKKSGVLLRKTPDSGSGRFCLQRDVWKNNYFS